MTFVLLWQTDALSHDSILRIETRGNQTRIISKGVPKHDIGRFPNRTNPNAFRAQGLQCCFPTAPQLSDAITTGLMTVSVSLTGRHPFRPYTAVYHDPE